MEGKSGEQVGVKKQVGGVWKSLSASVVWKNCFSTVLYWRWKICS